MKVVRSAVRELLKVWPTNSSHSCHVHICELNQGLKTAFVAINRNDVAVPLLQAGSRPAAGNWSEMVKNSTLNLRMRWAKE